MSEKVKWTGVDPVTIYGVGIFEPGKETTVTPEQAAIIRGTNEPQFVFTTKPAVKPFAEKKGEEK